MNHFFNQLLDYNYHVNKNLIVKITENETIVSGKIIVLINHIINAHDIWNGRILNRTTLGVWDLSAITKLQELNELNFQNSKRIIEQKELSSSYEFKRGGSSMSKSIQDTLFHIINHSTYHRAQIATEFKVCGLQPLATDYLFFKP